MTAVSQKGRKLADILMKNGIMNRYQQNDEENNFLVRAESSLADYFGLKYCLGVNSGGSAIYLALKAVGVQANDLVLSNAFTFNAVPSSIVHAGAQPILVECDANFVIDTDHLVSVLDSYKSCTVQLQPRFLLLSYMRGRCPNMDIVMKIVLKYKLILIEDIAHAYGVEWNQQKLGTFGVVCAVSTQANKLINSGEGGFILSNDDDIQAQCMIMSGCYEQYPSYHGTMMPKPSIIDKYIETLPNYSLRMTNLQGAIILPQIALINERRKTCQQLYCMFVKEIETKMKQAGIKIHIQKQLKQVNQVPDNIQFVVQNMSKKQIAHAIIALKQKLVKMNLFGFSDNARYYKTWKFISNLESLQLPQTEKYLQFACDMRIPLHWTKNNVQQTTDVIADVFHHSIV